MLRLDKKRNEITIQTVADLKYGNNFKASDCVVKAQSE